MRHPIVVTLATAFVLGAPPLHGIAHARPISPMEVSVISYGDRFTANLEVANPYFTSREFEIIAYDERGLALKLSADDADLSLLPGAARKVVIAAPFNSVTRRKILVCVATKADPLRETSRRAQACSKARRKRL